MDMPISSSRLEAFLAVAQSLNFTKAARSLNITQSALSQRVLLLEEELETTLFVRDRAGLKLTEAALSLIRYCQMKNSLEEEFLGSLTSKVSNRLTGVIRIGGYSSVTASVIVPAISSLVRENPDLKVQTMSRELGELLPLLKRGEIDYMISDGRIDRDELERVLLGKERYFLAASTRRQCQDVYLYHDENDETTFQFLKLSKPKAIAIKRHYLGDIHSLIEGVKNGLGKAVLPYHLITREKDIKIIDSDRVLEVPVYLYFYSRPFYSKLHAEILEKVMATFRQGLSSAHI